MKKPVSILPNVSTLAHVDFFVLNFKYNITITDII